MPAPSPLRIPEHSPAVTDGPLIRQLMQVTGTQFCFLHGFLPLCRHLWSGMAITSLPSHPWLTVGFSRDRPPAVETL